MRIVRTFVGVAVGVLIVCLFVPSTHAAAPSPFVIDFTGETDGFRPNGYSSSTAPGVSFFDTSGADLEVFERRGTIGPGLWVGSDDASAVEIRIATPTTSIRLFFGNDDPEIADVTDLAQLTVFRGATEVAQVLKKVNANDLPDQAIAYTGTAFDRVQFQYVDATQVPINLIEAIDNIRFAPMCTVTGTAGNNRLTGTARSDVICGEGGNDIIRGLGGADLIYGGVGSDRISGGGGGDVIVGDNGSDTIAGGPGADRINGGRGNDTLSGGGGADVLNGGLQRDTCNGGPAVDRGPGCEVRTFIP